MKMLFTVTIDESEVDDRLDPAEYEAIIERTLGSVLPVAIERGLPELWGVKAVAEHLGLNAYQQVYKRVGKGLPEPVVEMERGQLWLADDIREYARAKEAA